jgi:nitroreductase
VSVVTWLTPEEFSAAVGAATRAPSMHNSQPWRFRLGDRHVDLLVDPDRRLPVADASGWAGRIAGGAALFNLRLALLVAGKPAAVRILPDRADPRLLARLTPAPARPPNPTERRLHHAIPRRHSNRGPFQERPVPAAARTDLIGAAKAEGAWLDLLLGAGAVEVAAELAHTADELLRRDAAYQAELAAWTRTDASARDGVPVAAGGPVPRPYDLLPRRVLSETQPDPVHQGFAWEPLVAVLGGAGDWPSDQIQVGQALQRVLLTATDLGLAVSMFSQPIEVPAVREQLRLALGRPVVPQMLLRFGYATLAPASNRRPAADVVSD